ncbi:MAG: DUF3024 domain-containing protein, partial [Thiotrichales bacterium]|nr:DUF3024 domain-containing protein [Thiotrichales bacterium]MBT7006256.1 DUF3024 domain-containing protein [Thiotrichales bacterium]
MFEIRPQYSKPNVKIEISVAKATYVKSREVWSIYWMMSDLKWHRYA